MKFLILLISFIFFITNYVLANQNNKQLSECKRDIIYDIPSKKNLKPSNCISSTNFSFNIINNNKDKNFSSYQKPSEIGKKPKSVIILED